MGNVPGPMYQKYSGLGGTKCVLEFLAEELLTGGHRQKTVCSHSRKLWMQHTTGLQGSLAIMALKSLLPCHSQI